jgi:hypothetical protein
VAKFTVIISNTFELCCTSDAHLSRLRTSKKLRGKNMMQKYFQNGSQTFINKSPKSETILERTKHYRVYYEGVAVSLETDCLTFTNI